VQAQPLFRIGGTQSGRSGFEQLEKVPQGISQKRSSVFSAVLMRSTPL
jgi:hypothetical protein